jgi:large subunit ribosomal protein L21
MYAVIEQGGKQYKVAEGDLLDIDLVVVDPKATTLELDKVLLVSDGKDVKLGKPYVEGAKVIASFKSTADEGLIKGPKLHPTHFRKRKSSRRRMGHRQKYLQVTVSKIQA